MRRRARRSPTALNRIDLDELAHDATRQLRLRHGKSSWAAACPERCDYTLAQIMDDDFVPSNRHGIPAED